MDIGEVRKVVEFDDPFATPAPAEPAIPAAPVEAPVEAPTEEPVGV